VLSLSCFPIPCLTQGGRDSLWSPIKLQHWRAFQAENGWNAAPVLEFVALVWFPALIEFHPLANDVECMTDMLAVAAGDIDEAALAVSIRRNLAKG